MLLGFGTTSLGEPFVGVAKSILRTTVPKQKRNCPPTCFFFTNLAGENCEISSPKRACSIFVAHKFKRDLPEGYFLANLLLVPYTGISPFKFSVFFLNVTH